LDCCLIGLALFELSTWSWIVSPTSWLVILLVAVGLGLVIFVHELGHFVVAKLCGVKCEKFYLGFDIAGWRICRFRWGETEYGIGAFPLGGYVKMLGQEDNPARLKEELQRAKAAQAAGTGGVPTASDADDDGEPVDLAAAEAALYDPRSYLAQSVPKRMAIISAGVIMNMVFAFVAATAAFLIGVNETQCEVGLVQPGDPAWQANVTPGDRIVEINGKPTRRFRDLLAGIHFSNEGEGVPIRIERPGHDGPIELTLRPNRDRLLPAIGVGASHTTSFPKLTGWLGDGDLRLCVPGTPVARAEPPFQLGDQIVKVDDLAVETGPQLDAALSARRAGPVTLTIERATGEDKSPERLTIDVAPRPMLRLGLVMKMGPVMAVQQDSPAARAGVKPDDVLMALDGQPIGNPISLPNRLWAQVNQAVDKGDTPPTVTLTVKRGDTTLDLPVTLRQTDAFEIPLHLNSPVSVPALGLAYKVSNQVAAVEPGSPAAAADVAPGDVLEKVTLLKPDAAALARYDLKPGDVGEDDADLAKYPFDWPLVFGEIQKRLPDQKVKLEFAGGKNVTLVPVAATDWFNPERGFLCEQLQFTLTAQSFGEALRLGGAETLEQAYVIVRSVVKLITGGVSPKAIGGPIKIAQCAGAAATQGLSDFLIFLTTISVMLAVLNFLPIPVLDGGHFVFLLYEGIRGKPVDERVQLTLSYVGLILLLALMIWAIGLDTTLIPRE